MKRNLLLLLILFLAVQVTLAQGYIDVDTNIQMGVVDNEHVKITSSSFSIHNDTSNPILFADLITNDLMIGTNNARATGVTMEATGPFHVSIFRNSDDKQGPTLRLGKTRSTTTNGTGLVGNNDKLGKFMFIAGNGASTSSAAEMHVLVDGTPVGDQVNGRYSFMTRRDGELKERVVIKSDGNVGIGTPDPTQRLEVSGNIKASSVITNGDVILTGRQRLKTLNLYTGAGGTISTTLGNNLYPLYAQIDLYGTQTNLQNEKVYWTGIVIADPGNNQINTVPFVSSKLSVTAVESGSSIILNITDNSNGKYVVLKGMSVVWQ